MQDIIYLDAIWKSPRGSESIYKSKSSRLSNNHFIWRIWLSWESELSNSLITPCKWTGSVRYVHEDCLKIWLNSKRVFKETPYLNSYYWSDIKWELCKTIYPDTVMQQNGNIIKIIEYKVPEKEEYVVLEGTVKNNRQK